MSKIEHSELVEKVTAGVRLAIARLIEKAKQEDDTLVLSKDGKIIHIKARDIK